MYNIMIVDDEENILNSLRRMFTKNKQWEIEYYSDPKKALNRARTMNFDLFLSDYRMPEVDGIQFLTEVRQIQPEAMRLILSGYTDLEALLGAINKAEIYRFINKPWQDYELTSTIEQALEHREILVENRRLADQVREQQQELDKRGDALKELCLKHPALVEINWSEDGSIILDVDSLQ